MTENRSEELEMKMGMKNFERKYCLNCLDEYQALGIQV